MPYYLCQHSFFFFLRFIYLFAICHNYNIWIFLIVGPIKIPKINQFKLDRTKKSVASLTRIELSFLPAHCTARCR